MRLVGGQPQIGLGGELPDDALGMALWDARRADQRTNRKRAPTIRSQPLPLVLINTSNAMRRAGQDNHAKLLALEAAGQSLGFCAGILDGGVNDGPRCREWLAVVDLADDGGVGAG